MGQIHDFPVRRLHAAKGGTSIVLGTEDEQWMLSRTSFQNLSDFRFKLGT
jgi:hypothetical protein